MGISIAPTVSDPPVGIKKSCFVPTEFINDGILLSITVSYHESAIAGRALYD